VICKALSSPEFGASVLLPVGVINGKRDKKNPLYDEIKAINIDVLHGGGVYTLLKVRQQIGSCVYLDI
jgi:hypothetical protein